MLETMFLGLALSVGQTGEKAEGPPTASPPPPVPIGAPAVPSIPLGSSAIPVYRLTRVAPQAAPAADAPASAPASPALFGPTGLQPVQNTEPAAAPAYVNVPVLPLRETASREEEQVIEEDEVERWGFMRSIQGTWMGAFMEDNRLLFYGWTEASYTASTNDVTNQPMVWNDRANRFLLNQHWMRLERTVVKEGTMSPTWGFRADVVVGSDYRFMIQRGFWNSQLENADGVTQNLYGVDMPSFYANLYVPTLFNGVEFRAGRLFTPFGYESLEAISTPFVSRSYAFNWCPPFTHMGLGAYVTFNSRLTGVFMLANGNDVFFDPSQEARFVGAVTYALPTNKDTITFGTSVGRGKFNSGDPLFPATVALPWEPAGRNNINVFDLVWIHTFNPKLSYGFEAIYGYQNNVPYNVLGGAIGPADLISGTANWGSLVHYINYKVSEKVTSITRFETFDDFEGQRTGFEGLYFAATTGLQIALTKSVIFRPEIRWDYNDYSHPFEGKPYLLSGAADLIVRW